MEDLKEEWRDIKGYVGKYQVSNLGRVKSLKDTHGNYKEKIMKGSNCYGYKRVELLKDKKRKHIYVHRLVAIAFIPNPNNHPIINHKDENKTNNKIENLEWCNYKYNINYGTAIKRRSEKSKGREVKSTTRNKISKALKGIKRDNIKGSKHYFSSKIKCITTGEIFECMQDAVDKYKINNISTCCRGIQKYAGKLNGEKMVWEYYKEGNINE